MSRKLFIESRLFINAVFPVTEHTIPCKKEMHAVAR